MLQYIDQYDSFLFWQIRLSYTKNMCSVSLIIEELGGCTSVNCYTNFISEVILCSGNNDAHICEEFLNSIHGQIKINIFTHIPWS
jgi:hypothetical protein